MASLYKRGSTYYASFRCPTRGRKRVSLKTKDRQTARALLVEFERLWRLGEADPWHDDMHAALQPEPEEKKTVAEVIGEYLAAKEAQGVTARTLRSQESHTRRLTEGLEEEAPARAITPAVARSYVHASDVSVSTRATRYRYCSSFLRHAGLEEVIEAIERPKPEKKLPVACTEEELRSISKATLERYQALRRKRQVPPGKVIWRVPCWWFAFLTGLRRSELKRLQWEDVAASHIVLRKQKSRKEERLPISSKAQTLLRRISFGKRREGYVFTSPYASGRGEAWADRMTRSFTEYRKRAGVRDEITLHSLRAGFITQLARAGLNAVAIKRLARHSDIKTSLRYIEATGEAFRSGLDEAFGASS